MSTTYILIAFALCIVLMIALISKWKVHPVVSILLTSIVLAISIGTPWEKIESTINAGLAGTLKSIAIVIFLGCVLGKVLEETGAAIKITKATVNAVGKKNVIWAIAFSAAILGIPIWADSVVILLIPIVSTLALETNSSMMSYGTALYMGALITASLVPPTPGPVAAAALLHVPLGEAILWGIIVSIPGIIAATLYCKMLKEPVLPKEEYLNAAQKAKDMELPSLFSSLAPIILPLVLIIANTAINAAFPKTPMANFFTFIGSPLAALLAGCMLSLTLTRGAWRSKKVLNDWMEDSLRSGAMPIMVTGMGGALAAFIQNAGIAENIAHFIASINFPGVIIPVIIAAIIHVITGSNALGVMTAAALVQPMLDAMGLTPLVAFLGCATGALMFKQANSSGFWVTVTMSNMTADQGLKSVSVAATIGGFVSSVVAIAFFYMGWV